MAARPTVVGVLACSKRKLTHAAPAVDLYQGDVFRAARSYLERAGCTTLVVLSAKHGAVPGDRVLEPYDASLADLTRFERECWAERTGAELLSLAPRGAEVIAIVPALYAPALHAVPHERRFAGLSIGYLRRALRLALEAA
jgi:hypothetical protein